MRTLFALVLAAHTVATLPAQEIKVTIGDKDTMGTVLRIPMKLPTVVDVNGQSHAVQHVGDESYIMLDTTKANETLTIKPATNQKPAIQVRPVMVKEHSPERTDLFRDQDEPLVRFMHPKRTAENHYLNFKPYHQIFDQNTGENLTSSAHPDTKEYLYPHHRGVFFGFNKITYQHDGKTVKADIWHGKDNVYSQYQETTASESGQVFALHQSRITWHGPSGDEFASELREVRVYNIGDVTVMDWSTELSTKLDSVKLDGDPQHAGMHFRANQDVAKKTAKKTYYIRPDGIGKPGETRNWDADPKKRQAKTTNLPWNAVRFELNDVMYTVLRMSHPENPKETRGSERDYGRFGDYFEYELTPMKPLKLQYRIVAARFITKVEQCELMYAGYTQQPKIEISKAK
jgi:hypothetical protein